MSEDSVTSIFGPGGQHLLIKPNGLVRGADIWVTEQTCGLPAHVSGFWLPSSLGLTLWGCWDFRGRGTLPLLQPPGMPGIPLMQVSTFHLIAEGQA